MSLPLRAILAFHAVANRGTMIQAAAELGVTPSAVSQQVRQLETYVGSRLFTRIGRRLILTETGELYFKMIRGDVEQIGAATRRIRGYGAVQVLNLRVAPTFAVKCVLPRLDEFLLAHPEIEVRVNATNEPYDFGAENVDLEIRHGVGGWSGFHVESIVEERVMPLCSPDYLAPGSIDLPALLDHLLIFSVKNVVQWPHWFRAAGLEPQAGFRRVLFDRAHMSIDLAAQGTGIALESHVTARRELAEGRLACPLRTPVELPQQSLWLVCPHSHLARHKVATFVSWLRSTLPVAGADAPGPVELMG